jgi:DNA-binding MarR family transcriptional regulator
MPFCSQPLPVVDRVDRLLAEWRGAAADAVTGRVVLAKRLAAAAGLVEAAGAQAVARLGLDPGEFDALAALLRQGSPYEMSPRKLSDSGFVSSSGMTKRLDRLEARGLVRRRPDPDDRRALRVSLTEAGVELAGRAIPVHAEALEAALSGLGDDEVTAFDRLLRLITTGADAER